MQQQAPSTDLPWFWSGWQDASLWEDGQVPLWIGNEASWDAYAGKVVAVNFVGLCRMQECSRLDLLPAKIYVERYPEEIHYWKCRPLLRAEVDDKLYFLPPYLVSDFSVPCTPSEKIAVITMHEDFAFVPMKFGGKDKAGLDNSHIEYEPVAIPEALRSSFFEIFSLKMETPFAVFNDFLPKALACDVWVCVLHNTAMMHAITQLAAKYSKKILFMRRNNFVSYRRGAFFEWLIRQPIIGARLPHLFFYAKKVSVVDSYLAFSKEHAKIEKMSDLERFETHWHYLRAHPIPWLNASKPVGS